MDPIGCAWAAGFFEGEGCIHIAKRRACSIGRRHRRHVRIGMDARPYPKEIDR